MNTILRFFHFLINIYTADVGVRDIYYIGDTGGPNIMIRTIVISLLLSASISLLFYLAGRKFNLRYLYQWILLMLIGVILNTLYCYNQVFQYVWFLDPSTSLDIDWAFILSPQVWFVMFFTLFSKIWLSIKGLTLFAKFNPSFLTRKR